MQGNLIKMVIALYMYMRARLYLCARVREYGCEHSEAKNKEKKQKNPTSMWSRHSAAKRTPPNAALLERKRGV